MSHLVLLLLILAVIVVAIVVALAGWDRYRPGRDRLPSAQAHATNEVFVDPETGMRKRVWFDPTTGRREYRDE